MSACESCVKVRSKMRADPYTNDQEGASNWCVTRIWQVLTFDNDVRYTIRRVYYSPLHSKSSSRLNSPLKTISWLLFPTRTSYLPTFALHTFRAVSQYETAYLSIRTITTFDFPESISLALENPRSCIFGVVTPISGRVMYTWTTSEPVVGPSLVIVTSTESEKEAASREEGLVIEILEKEKVVYDNPKLSETRDVNKNRLESKKDHPPKRE